ncbi:MAG: TetR/AcrR family transcriptional regulator [bacterium]
MARPKSGSKLDIKVLIASAELAFAEHGFRAARLEDIARTAGISRPSLLYHFASKDELYEAVVDGIFADLGGSLRDSMTRSDTFEARLRDLTVGFTRFMATRPAAASLLVRELVAPDGPGRARLVEHGAPLLDEIDAWVIAERPQSPISVRAVLLHVVSDTLLRNAVGELQQTFWRDVPGDAGLALVERLILAQEKP